MLSLYLGCELIKINNDWCNIVVVTLTELMEYT